MGVRIVRKAFEEVGALNDLQKIYRQKGKKGRPRVRLWCPEGSSCLVGSRC